MKLKLLSPLLVFCFLTGYTQSPTIDSLKNKLAHTPPDTNQLKLLLNIGLENQKELWGYEEEKKYGALAQKLNDSLLQSAHGKNNAVFNFCNKYQIEIDRCLGRANYYQHNYTEAVQYFNHSVEVIKAGVTDSHQLHKSIVWIGDCYKEQRNYAEALSYYKQSMQLTEALGDTMGYGSDASRLADLYTKQGNDSEAIKYHYIALNTTKNALHSTLAKNHNRLEVLIYNLTSTSLDLGNILLRQNKYDEALKILNEAAETAFSTTGDKYAYTPLSMTGDVYIAKGDFNQALSVYRKCMAFYLKNNYELSVAINYLNQGVAKMGLGEYKPALSDMEAGLSIAIKVKAPAENMKGIYQELARAYEKNNDYKNSYKYNVLYHAVKDTLEQAENKKQLNETLTQYETEKKDNQIKLLNKDKQIQTAEITHQKNMRNGFVGGFAILLVFTGVVYRQRNRISKEKKRSDELLLNILPAETAEELKNTGAAKAKSYDMVTILFTDFKNFTKVSEQMTADQLVAEINDCYSQFDKITARYGVEKIKTIGDSYMCAGGLPAKNQTHAEDVVNAAIEMRNFISNRKSSINIQADENNTQPARFEVRIGIHTGPVVAGIVGIKKFAYDIWGDTVNIASRMESSGQAGMVNISEATYELVKLKFQCTYRGEVDAKNKGKMKMYFVENAEPVHNA